MSSKGYSSILVDSEPGPVSNPAPQTEGSELPDFCSSYEWHLSCPVSKDCLKGHPQLIASFARAKIRLYRLQEILKVLFLTCLLISIASTVCVARFPEGSAELKAFRRCGIVSCLVGAFAGGVSGYCWSPIHMRRRKQKLHGIPVWKKRNWFMEAWWVDYLVGMVMACWAGFFIESVWRPTPRG
ncbi:hypothetical protein TWF481_007091 [Arthrobotrys musiformis]|uniref:C3H1-type domain-containing protein n=1 Tax=Arthrobotrys musiformis TaxID=47236 RepID=A0AAV9WG65_9PEZI